MKTGTYDEVQAAVRWPVRGTRHLPGGLAVTRYDGDALLIHHWESGQAVLLESRPELETIWAAVAQSLQERRQGRS
ncbi:MAG: hypothetical protein CL878_13355 [Dehalococcoidia bacterium]|nr:hypothetical protein [Dehalococcoidia bacterium]